MPRPLGYSAFACVSAALAIGCAGSPEAEEPSADDLVGKPQGRTLELPRGASAARFTITALPPPRHTWDVRVVAPARANVGVRIRTWYGQRLRVLDSTRDKTSCRIGAARSVCSLAFPRLEAQRPGAWTVIVFKRTTQPAPVRVEVTFNAE